MNGYQEDLHPRAVDGKYINKEHPETDAGLTALAPVEASNDTCADCGSSHDNEAVCDEPTEFSWVRIESMMGRDFLLDPERTASIPKINIDDNVAKMTRKLTRYVAKTQDFSSISDEEVARLAGFAPGEEDATLTERIRRNFNVPDGERLVFAVDESGDPVYLSCGSAFNRTGLFQMRGAHQTFGAYNMADRMVVEKFHREFAAEHPEFDEKRVATMFRRLGDKDYASKKNEFYWDEDVVSDKVKLVLGTVVAQQIARGERKMPDGMTSEDLVKEMDTWSPETMRELVAQAPRGTTDAYSRSKGFHKVEAYEIPMISNGMPMGKSYISIEEVEMEIAGITTRAQRAAMNRAYREFLEEQLQVEYDFQLNRKYVRNSGGGHGATVFEQKKNVPTSHLRAAETGSLANTGDFRHIEIDEDVDLEKFHQIESEYDSLRKHLPQTTKAALRFRKTGRHGARGVYHPHADNIAVDPRYPSSFVHEFIHHVDHTAGGKNISSSDEFKTILRATQRRLKEAEQTGVAMNLEYLQTPTEVLSRSAELYFHWKKPGTSLNGDGSKYTGPGYDTLAPMKSQIIEFWDRKLTELGAEVPEHKLEESRSTPQSRTPSQTGEASRGTKRKSDGARRRPSAPTTPEAARCPDCGYTLGSPGHQISCLS